MVDPIRVEGLKLDDLQAYAAQNKGFLKGRVDGQGMLELYVSKQGTGRLEREITPQRPWERQQLAGIALYEAVANSYGHEVADKVMNSLRRDLLNPNSYMTADLVNRAKDLAEKASRGGELPNSARVQQPPPAKLSSEQLAILQKGDDGSGDKVAPLKVARPAQDVHGSDDGQDDDDDDVADGLHHPDFDRGKPTPEGAEDARQRRKVADADVKGPPSPAIIDNENDDEIDITIDVPDPKEVTATPNHQPPVEQAEPPTLPIRKKIDVVAEHSDESIAARKRRLQGGGRPRRGMSLDDITKNLKQRDVNNRMHGQLFLKRNNFGALLKAARHPNGMDRLGSASGFSMDAHRPDFQGPTKTEAEQVILKAFETYGDGVVKLSERDKQQIAINALREYLALPMDPKTD